MTNIGLAVQGSFGHMFYALGVLEAFRKHNASSNNQKMYFTCASGCVEMLLPLLMFTKDQHSPESFQTEVDKPELNSPFALLPAQLDMQSWARWAESLTKSVLAPFATGELVPEKLFEDLSGPPGNFYFNPAWLEEMKPRLGELMIATEVPVFTNATSSADFSEIYLYAGKVDDLQLQDLRGEKEGNPKRKVLPMTPDLYFASGARPPYLAPIEVVIDGSRQYWMEGAMRCNPPLRPLIKAKAVDSILLLRFFAKNRTTKPSEESSEEYWAAENEAALFERYLEAIFTIPLEKEKEEINLLSGETVKGKYYKPVEIKDPMEKCCFDIMSHYRIFAHDAPKNMFKNGINIGEQIISGKNNIVIPTI